MADIVVGVKITAEGGQLVATLDSANAKVKVLGDNAGIAGRAIDGVTGYLARFATIGAGIALAQKFIEISDASTTLNARMREAIGTTGDLAAVQSSLFATANRLQSSYASLAGGFVPVAEAIRDMGGSADTATKVVQALAAAAKAGGQSSEEAAQQMQQFANVLTLGVNGGRDLTAILRENDNVARALADAFGVSTTALKRMAQDGQITGQQLVTALVGQLGQLQEAAAKIPPTVGGAITVYMNSLSRAAAETGISGKLAQALTDITTLADRAGQAAITMGDRFRLANIAATQGASAALDDLNRRFKTGTIGGGVASGSAESSLFGGAQAFGNAENDFLTISRGLSTVEQIKADAGKLRDAVNNAWGELIAADASQAQKYAAQRQHDLQAINTGEQAQLDALAKRGVPNLSALFGNWESATAAEQAGLTNAEKLQQDSLNRQLATLEFSHQAFLVSDTDYYRQREALQQQSAQADISTIQSQIANVLALYAKESDARAVGADQAEEKQSKLAALTKQLGDLYTSLALAEGKAGDVGVQAANGLYLANEKLMAQLIQIGRASQDYNIGLQNQVGDLQLQLSLVGQTATAQQQATTQRQLEVAAAAKILDYQRQINDEEAKGPNADPLKVAALQSAMQNVADSTRDAAQASNGLIASIGEATDRASALSDAFHSVDAEAYQLFQKFGSGWKGVMEEAASDVKSILVRALYEMTVQKWIVSIFANIGAGGATQGAGSTLTALGALAGGNSPLGGIANLAGLGGGGGLGGLATSFATSGLGSTLGLSTIATTTATDAAFAGTLGAVTDLGAAAATTGTVLTSAGAAFAAAIPVIGWAIAAAAAVYGIVQANKQPTPVKGQFGIQSSTSGFEDNAYTASPFGNLGFLDAGTQQFSGQAGQALNIEVAAALNAIAQRLSPDAIARVAANLQATKFPGKEGDFTTEDFIKQYGGDVLKQVITVALQELDPALATLTSQFKGDADAVVNYANSLLAIHDAISGDPAKDATDALAAQSKTLYDTYTDQGKVVEELASKYDGSAASTTALATATATYRGELVQLLVQLKQLSAQIHSMFQDTSTSIAQAGLTPQQRYAYDQAQAQKLYEQIFTTKDPALIAQWSAQINSFINDAFSQLTPEEQLANKPTFLSHITDVDTAVGTYLDSLGTSLNTDAGTTFADVQTALNAAAGKMGGAGTTMQGAGIAMQGAVATMQQTVAELTETVKAMGIYVNRFGQATNNMQVTVVPDTYQVGA